MGEVIERGLVRGELGLGRQAPGCHVCECAASDVVETGQEGTFVSRKLAVFCRLNELDWEAIGHCVVLGVGLC